MKLPRLRIDAIHEQALSITFEESDWIGEDWITCLMHTPSKFIWGRLTSVDRERNTAQFVLESKEDLPYVQAGGEFDYLDGYWGERAELALDPSRVWTRRDFKSTDAVEFYHEGARVRGKAGQEPWSGAESVHLVEGGWDHEHCEICSETIGEYEGEQNTGYRSQKDEWICEHCHDSYVAPKSLQFIEDLTESGESDSEDEK